MHTSFRRIITGMMLFIITIIVATAGYVASGWSFIDSIYQVVITVFGVGFGEVQPINTPTLRVFTMLVIVGGTSSVVYAVGGLVQMITEGELNKALGVRRMIKTIATLENHVVICGFGRMGQILARELANFMQPFVIIDNSSDRITEAQELGYLVITGNATDEEVLQLAGIERAQFLATALPDDAANVFITLTGRGLNPNLVILARGEFPTTERKLRLAGANHVVLPATIGAMRMAHMITHPATLDFLDRNNGGSSLNEMLAHINLQLEELLIPKGSPMIGHFVKDIEASGKGSFMVVALKRAEGQLVTSPGTGVAIHEGDIVIVMGRRGDIPKIENFYTLKQGMRYRGAKH
ncbi:potassium channel family protein [Leptolyngbya sp. AN02str]|uniref:potassium channel family protein n=1 Tax=Leptolyngbya sp. AN02str TaxID=3423363 RepID=UPI003D31D7D2